MTGTTRNKCAVATAVLLLSVWLSGCGSSPPVRYFQLAAMDSPGQQAHAETVPGAETVLRAETVLGIGPFELPDYLDRPQIVSRGAGAELVVDDFHRWAEALDAAVVRTLAMNIGAQREHLLALAYPFKNFAGLDYQLTARIMRFEADADGGVELLLHWQLHNVATDELILRRTSRYKSRANPGNTPSGRVAAMSDVLQQFSADVARALPPNAAPAGGSLRPVGKRK